MSKARVSKKDLRRAFELGALSMQKLSGAQCGTETESLMEGLETDAGLTNDDRNAMRHQIDAIEVIEDNIFKQTVADAAYYGSYLMAEKERCEIKTLFPRMKKRW